MKPVTMLMNMIRKFLFIYQMLFKHTWIILFLLIYMLGNTKRLLEMASGVLRVYVAYITSTIVCK